MAQDHVEKHQYGQFGSWEIVDENVARKICDNSFFKYRGSDVAQDVRWFFGVDDLPLGGKKKIVLVNDEVEFEARFIRETTSLGRIRIFWSPALAEKFASFENDGKQHSLEFTRIDMDRYEVVFIEKHENVRAWLLTWNRKSWYWDEYPDDCERVNSGIQEAMSWTCTSLRPKIGDEIFLIKLGEQPRGIIGHGRVTRESYEDEHYDPIKASEGKRSKYIDILFDRLINYENHKILLQDDLQKHLSAQHWSPQASGIEIKPEVLPALNEMWEAVTKTDKYGLDKIASFLKEYSGKHYIAPLKAGDQAEYMARMKKRGQEARALFIQFIQEAIKDIPDLEFVSCSNWMTQGQDVQSYLWIELKKKEWKKYPNSVSISIEKNDTLFGNEIGITIRSETKDNASNSEDYKKQFRLLDLDLLEGMTYLIKDKNGEVHYNETDTEAVKELCDDGFILKLEVIEVIEQLTRDESTIFSEMQNAIKEIYPFYGYVMSDSEKTDEDEWWPSLEEYDPGISAHEYFKYLSTESIVKRTWANALYELYLMSNHMASCKQLGDKYGHSPSQYNRYFSSAGQNIQKVTGIGSPEDDKNAKYWPVLFQGKSTADGYCYRLREPVCHAISMLMSTGMFLKKENDNVVQFDRNLILYGPPGTGKTYNSVIYAVAICEGKELDEVKKEPYSDVLNRYRELKEDERIAFTTFHQSYGYEEFIEGIKPKLNAENESLGYTIEDGIFKAFCKRAGAVKIDTSDDHGLKANPHIWGMLLGGTGSTEIKQYCFDNNVIRFAWDHITDNDLMDDNSEISKNEKFALHQLSTFIYSMEVGDLVIIAKNITTIDAIGVITGEYEYDLTKETHSRTRNVKWLVKNVEIDIRPFLPNGRKQLPTSYLYPLDYLGIDNVSKILDELNERTEVYFETETKPYVFIIDEINRGNISKIFGELITLIEGTKRAGAPEAMEAILPYSGEAFSVPNNVYIIGTMNTADRSIALMDTALRRRFEFVEMMPETEVLESLGIAKIDFDGVELNVGKMLAVMNQRIKYLYDREHTIGHAFFIPLSKDASLDTLANIFEKKIIPLLQEYFYEDYEKIQLVLGDETKEEEYKFILDQKIDPRDVFNGSTEVDLPPNGYEIQHSAFRKIQSYKLIGKDL